MTAPSRHMMRSHGDQSVGILIGLERITQLTRWLLREHGKSGPIHTRKMKDINCRTIIIDKSRELVEIQQTQEQNSARALLFSNARE